MSDGKSCVRTDVSERNTKITALEGATFPERADFSKAELTIELDH